MSSEQDDVAPVEFELTQFENKIIKDMVSEVSENPLSFTASEHLFTLLDKFQVTPDNQFKMIHALAFELRELSNSTPSDSSDLYLWICNLASHAGQEKFKQIQAENDVRGHLLSTDKSCDYFDGYNENTTDKSCDYLERYIENTVEFKPGDTVKKESVLEESSAVLYEVSTIGCSYNHPHDVQDGKNVQFESQTTYSALKECPSSNRVEIEEKRDTNRKLSPSHQYDINQKRRKKHSPVKDHNDTQSGERTYSGTVFDELARTSDKPYKCDVCEKRFTQSNNLKMHMRTHTDEKPYKCDVCVKRFKHSGTLQKHKLNIHTGEKPYKCDACDKRFKQSGTLKIHLRTHTGEKPFKCDVCDKRFKQSGTLQLHKLLHTGEKPFKCDACDKRFKLSGYLQKHKLLHNEEKPYKCDLCDKGFKLSGYLIKHKLTHSGEKPYKCNVCDKRFIQSSNLHSHQFTHSGEKPYKCDVCDKIFSRSDHLRSHKFTHTGEKPYKCVVCDKRFMKFRGWELTHSGEKPSKCDDCDKTFKLPGD